MNMVQACKEIGSSKHKGKVIADALIEAKQPRNKSAKAPQKQFNLTQNQSRDVIFACPDCQLVTPLPPEGTNPRGLLPLQIWQTDVTHIGYFEKLKCIHVSTDTFLGDIVATTHTGEKSRDVQRHLLAPFVHMRVPKQIKTDDGPSYVAKSTQELALWGMEHATGIPHSPTGQGIVVRAHHTIKSMLERQKKMSANLSPNEQLQKVMYVLNFLNRLEDGKPPASRHFAEGSTVPSQKALILYKDLLTNGQDPFL
ncbi:endogenous retrovirus group K member 25 Pol protein-like protein [Pitangus sulphuratus]|nr:endogenous retrovirus group K member 25 Pol protein-like protein [Pitangus sulphuratus]